MKLEHDTACRAIGAVFFAIMLVFTTPTADGSVIEDRDLGFALTVPSGFEEHPVLAGATPDVAHAYVLGDPLDEAPDIVLLIERMRGVIGRERLSSEQAPPGFQGRVFQMPWKDFEINVFEIPEIVEGQEVITFNAQVPLEREAIQLKLVGAREQRSELLAILEDTLASLKGASNWSPSVGTRPAPLSRQYTTIMMLAAIMTILVGLVVLWVISRSAPRGAVLVVAAMIYVAGWTVAGVRVREVLLLSGTLKILGLAGIVLGIIDALRTRKSPVGGQKEMAEDAVDAVVVDE